MQRKREVQNRQQILAFVHKQRQGGRVVKALDCYSNTISVRGFESHLCRNPSGLGSDAKLKHAELQAPHSEQQTQCLENIWFKKVRKNNRQMWAHSNSLRMLDISGKTKKKTGAE